jgi:hypothetical protein
MVDGSSRVAFTDDHVVAHRCRRAGAVHPIKISGKSWRTLEINDL